MSEKRENYLEEIERLIRQVRFRTVSIVIQDGKVIQIDKTEKQD